MVKTKITGKIFLFSLLIFNFTALGQNYIRVMSYNLENYPNGHDADFAKVINQINPDIIVVVEMLSREGVNQFLNNALTAEYHSAPVNIHNDGLMPYNDCAFYFKYSVLTLIQTTEISADTRVISEFKMVHNTTKDTLIIFGVHFKAYPEDSTRRANAVTSLRNRTTRLNNKINYLICGDFNIFSSTETAFKKLLDKSSPGYFIDILNISGNWNRNPQFASACTWSTRGGINTRLDMILISPALIDPGGIDYVKESFKIFGNDGNHFYSDVNSGSNSWFPNNPAVGTSLKNASDHLPVYADLNFSVTTIIKENKVVPLQFELSQNYPNPFNPTTIINYRLSAGSHVTLKVYDLLGREIATLVSEYQNTGDHHFQFSNSGGQVRNYDLPSGVYFYRLTAGDYSSTKKMVVLK